MKTTRATLTILLLAGACGGEPAPPQVPPDIDRRVTINEVMADNAVTIEGSSDWVELYNPTAEDIPLRGYALTDDLGDRRRAIIGDEVLPAGGRLVVRLDDIGLDLAREGGELGLARPDGSYIDRLVYGTQEVDFAAAREPDGSDRWVIEWHASPGEANPEGDGAPVDPGAESDPPEEVPAAGDLSEQILGYDVIPELEIRLTDEAAAALIDSPRTYVAAELVFDGRVYGPVGLRLKGNKSFLPFDEKPSLRINVDEMVPGAKFFGLDDLTLNNMASDRSMLKERLAYRVAREAGVPASRANHALVTVNGDFYGLYSNVETVKWRMVGRWFDDSAGPLFEGVAADFVPGGNWELESGPDDRSMIEGVIDAMAISNPDQAIAAAGAHANLPQFRRFWAMCSVIGQFDSLPYYNDDYFAYADPDSGRLWFMPWGMDESFGSSNYHILETRSVLAEACKASTACYDAYVAEVWAIMALVEELGLEAERVRVADQIAAHADRDTRKPYSDADVIDGQNDVRWFLMERRQRLGEMLADPP